MSAVPFNVLSVVATQEVRESVVSDDLGNTVVVVGEGSTVVQAGTKAETVHTSAGIQGPRGYSAEDIDMYSKRIDFISDSLLYKGEASAGSLENSAAWRLRKIEIGVDGDVTETWADGDVNFDNAWTDRLTKVYS